MAVDITEVSFPPRVTQQVSKHGLKAGSALDLLTAWDFSQEIHRDTAWKRLVEEKPEVVILPPPPLLQKDNMVYEHVRFCAKVIRQQIVVGRFFCEQPASANSWMLDTVPVSDNRRV